MTLNHQFGNFYLLVDSFQHILFADRLLIAAHIIQVQIQIHIVNAVHIGKRLIHIKIVHVKSMFRQCNSVLPQQCGTIHHRVHHQILGRTERTGVFPGTHLLPWKNVPIAHGASAARIHTHVYVIAYIHIHIQPGLHIFPQAGKELPQHVPVQPVI